MLTIIFILIAVFFGMLMHYMHPIELDGRNTMDATWHRADHIYRRRHVE